MNDKLMSFLGLCRKAGFLTIGANPTIDSVKARRARLVVMAKDFSKNSAKPVLEAVRDYSVKALKIDRSKEDLSLAVGKLCAVCCVEDEGFAKKLILLIENELGGELDG